MADAGRLTPQKPHTNGDAASDAQRAKQSADADKPAFKVTFERPETRDAVKATELKSTEFKATELKASELKSPEMAGGKAAFAHVALVPEPAPANSYGSDAAPSNVAKGQNAPVPDSKNPETKNLDAKAGAASSLLGNPDASSAVTSNVATSPREIPSTTQMLTAPLLAIVAALSLLAAGWSYAKLNETRAQLASATEALTTVGADKAAASQAKATAEKAIAAASAEMANAAQVKTAAEKALADAQVRLSSVEKTVTEMKAALAAITTVAAPVSKPAGTPAASDKPPAK